MEYNARKDLKLRKLALAFCADYVDQLIENLMKINGKQWGRFWQKETCNRALFHKSMKLGTGIDHGTRSNFRYGPAQKMSNSGCGGYY